jgi:glycosyltransferase involved in cell wall biosynthesis
MKDERVAIIIPVYNEGTVIKEVVRSALKYFKHVICVDDGSRDNSIQEIAKTKAYRIMHPINMGQGAALQTGVEFARQLDVDYFVTFDADGQHQIEDVLTMLKKIRTGDYDIILGSRFLGKAVGLKNSKRIVLKAAIAFSNATSGLRLTDTHNGLRVFNRIVAEDLQITFPDMTHASEILGIIAEKKYRYVEVPVTIKYTEYSQNKGQSIANAVNIAFDLLLRKITK